MKQAVIIFTRVPEPGVTKTRMMPELSPAECARLHTCFLKDIREACVLSGAEVFVNYTAVHLEKVSYLKKILGEDLIYFPQEGAGLGERMKNAMKHVFDEGYDSCVLIGTDIPELRAYHLTEAFHVLEEKDVVFGKTVDGGYYLVGMNRLIPEAFGLNQYGHSHVFEETLEILEASGVSVGYTGALQDMDIYEDLADYRDRMRIHEWHRSTFTGKYLNKISRISVIIPVYNEEKTIEKLQKQLDALEGKCEIIFVDGGSKDRTLELIEQKFTVLHEHKERAAQMNLGAKESHGDILFFLHCDSELPKHPLAEIRRVMQKHRAGCFGIAFHSMNFFMFTCRMISNHRIKDRKVMFGDQGIFVDRRLFFEAGMFPELPIMEDYQFSLTLKEMGVKLGMTRHRIYTSDRRFPKGTIPKLRVMWKMNRLRKMYRDGVDIYTISEMYKDVR